MRHVTDGELHAYLDGALDLLPQGRGDEIREHLSRCATCRERLQDEEEIRDQAQSLLAGSAPATGEIPSFEEIRALAEGREAAESQKPGPALGSVHTRGPLRGLPLAWAATVVLALGVGWMGGEVWRSLPGAGPGAQDTGVAHDPRGMPLLEAPAGAGRARMDLSPDPAEAGLEAAPMASVDEGDTRISSVAERTEESPSPERSPEALLRRQVSLPGAPGTKAGAPGTKALEGAMIRQGAVSRAEESRLDPAGAGAWPFLEGREELFAPEDEGAIRGRPESSLAVPGLPVISVEWEEWVPGEDALRIRQLLSMGDTLELRYLGLLLGTAPKAGMVSGVRDREPWGAERPLSPAVLEASLPPGWNQVEMRWGRGWLVARAPLPEKAIRSLLRYIE